MSFRPALICTLFLLGAAPALAAWDGDATFPGGVPRPSQPVVDSDAGMVVAQDTTIADVLARVQRLEGQNRQLTGRVDELTNLLKRTQDDFKKYRDDTEFRLQSLEGGGKAPKKRTEGTAPSTTGVAAAQDLGTTDLAAPQPALPKSGDGGPVSLGTLAIDPANPDGAAQDETATAETDANQPLDLTKMQGGANAGGVQTGLAPPGLPGVAVDTSQPIVASAPTNSPKDEFDLAYGFLQRKDYEVAELSFRKFLTEHPDDSLIPDATHWLGESMFQRKQYRDAAEQFLKVTTDFGKSRRAPSSMLRLGMSLASLGEKEAACATLQEVGRKYPAATDTVKSAVQREITRNKC